MASSPIKKPCFDPRVPAQRLFPMKEIAARRGKAPELRIGEYSETSIKISVLCGREDAARLIVEATNRLLVVRATPDLSRSVRDLVWTDKSDFNDWNPNPPWVRRTYSSLNWYADITCFEMLVKGLGALWYEKHLEPYFKARGFTIAAIHGTCLDAQKGVEAFWRERGFSAGEAVSPLMDVDDVVEHIMFKDLTAASV